MAFRRKDEDEPFDPYELGTRRMDPTLGALDPLFPNPRKVAPKTLLIYLLGAIFVFAVLSESHHRGVPSLAASCTKPAFALQSTKVTKDALLGWSAVGPATDAVVLAADTTTLPTSFATGRLAGPAKLLKCAAQGRMAIPLPAGPHTISAFQVLPDGTAVLLGSKKITVTS